MKGGRAHVLDVVQDALRHDLPSDATALILPGDVRGTEDMPVLDLHVVIHACGHRHDCSVFAFRSIPCVQDHREVPAKRDMSVAVHIEGVRPRRRCPQPALPHDGHHIRCAFREVAMSPVEADDLVHPCEPSAGAEGVVVIVPAKPTRRGPQHLELGGACHPRAVRSLIEAVAEVDNLSAHECRSRRRRHRLLA
eukprot:scaffold3753_cov257-Pinguiococcus_pyrenoidosus.AAC.8